MLDIVRPVTATPVKTSTVDLDGPVHFADFGGSGPSIVLVHGLGGSHINWMRVGSALSTYGRVLAPDLIGFGRTVPDRRSPGVMSNRALVDRFTAEVGGGDAILVGNSMGGLISLLQAARRPHRVRGLVLVDPALFGSPGHRPDPAFMLRGAILATPFLGEFMARAHEARTTPEQRVREVLDLCCVDPTRVPDDVVAAHVEMTAERELMPWSLPAHVEAARSIAGALIPPLFNRTVCSVAVPTLLVHGTEDRLVPVDAARHLARRRPDWTYAEFEGVGHAPMLDEPDLLLDAVVPFLRDN